MRCTAVVSTPCSWNNEDVKGFLPPFFYHQPEGTSSGPEEVALSHSGIPRSQGFVDVCWPTTVERWQTEVGSDPADLIPCVDTVMYGCGGCSHPSNGDPGAATGFLAAAIPATGGIPLGIPHESIP